MTGRCLEVKKRMINTTPTTHWWPGSLDCLLTIDELYLICWDLFALKLARDPFLCWDVAAVPLQQLSEIFYLLYVGYSSFKTQPTMTHFLMKIHKYEMTGQRRNNRRRIQYSYKSQREALKQSVGFNKKSFVKLKLSRCNFCSSISKILKHLTWKVLVPNSNDMFTTNTDGSPTFYYGNEH